MGESRNNSLTEYRQFDGHQSRYRREKHFKHNIDVLNDISNKSSRDHKMFGYLTQFDYIFRESYY